MMNRKNIRSVFAKKRPQRRAQAGSGNVFRIRPFWSTATWVMISVLYLVSLSAEAAKSKTLHAGYALVYDAEPTTCQHFLKLFNGDIAKYGYIDPAAHGVMLESCV